MQHQVKPVVKPPPNWLVIFETSIDGELAQVDVPTWRDPMRSRQVRKAAESVARLSFKQLSPKFHLGQAIKVVEILPIV